MSPLPPITTIFISFLPFIFYRDTRSRRFVRKPRGTHSGWRESSCASHASELSGHACENVTTGPLPSLCNRLSYCPSKTSAPSQWPRQAQSNSVAANISEHFVVGEVGVEAVDRSRVNAGKRKKQSVKLCLAAA